MTPTYTLEPYVIPESGNLVPGLFAILEDGHPCCKINVWDSLNDILKRGIPYPDAVRLYREMQTD